MIYDVIVIGGGPGGYHAALEGAKYQLKTLLIEASFVGGTCLKEGCIPTKILLKSAEVYETVKSSAQFGISVEHVIYNHETTIQWKNKVIEQLNKGVLTKLKKANVEIVQGFGKIVSRENGYVHIACGEKVYKTKNLIIATGSTLLLPQIEGINERVVVTSTELLEEKMIPEKLVIIGGGVIGIEMAEVFHKLGTTVEMLEFQQTIGGALDETIADALQAMLEGRGVNITTGASVEKIVGNSVFYRKDGKTYETKATKVLLSTGRKGNIEHIGLEQVGVEVVRSFVKTDDRCLTNIPNIYAIGDANGKSLLAHTAYREAEIAIASILGKNVRMNYASVPSVIYTSPEVASVGVTTAQAKAHGLAVKEIVVPLYYSGRFLVEDSDEYCFIKILIDEQYKKIMGVHLFAPFASEIVFGMTILIEQELRIEDLKRIIIVHPSIAEILKEAVHIYELEEARL